MDVQTCPGCKQRDEKIAELKQRLSALEARLNTNSSNSSMPPSSDPLDAKPPVTKKKKKKRRGGQPGHPPYLKKLLAPEQGTRIKPTVPELCWGCEALL